MWRGKLFLLLGWLLSTSVGVATVLLLSMMTAFSGGTAFLIATLTGVAAFGLYAYIVTKLGY